jgi:hypothetical protein
MFLEPASEYPLALTTRGKVTFPTLALLVKKVNRLANKH